MGAGASQNFSQATQGTPLGAGGQYGPINSSNAAQAIQQARGNPMAAWMLPMRTLTGMISQGGAPPQPQLGQRINPYQQPQLGQRINPYQQPDFYPPSFRQLFQPSPNQNYSNPPLGMRTGGQNQTMLGSNPPSSNGGFNLPWRNPYQA